MVFASAHIHTIALKLALKWTSETTVEMDEFGVWEQNRDDVCFILFGTVKVIYIL